MLHKLIGIKMYTHKEKLLIVEDDLLLLLVEERISKRIGYDVVGTTGEGELALDKIKTLKPDIILMDINLRGKMKGTDVVERMRHDGNDTPVVFLSGDTDPKMIEKVKHLGCIDYLIKPVTTAKLTVSLAKAAKFKRIFNQNAA